MNFLQRAPERREPVKKYKNSFRLELETNRPSHVSPMKRFLDQTGKPVQLKPRAYFTEKREF